MTVLQYSRLLPCRNCGYEVRYVRDIENAATPKANNWLCPNCGIRVPAAQVEKFVANEYTVADAVVVNTTLSTPFYLATPDLGGYSSVLYHNAATG